MRWTAFGYNDAYGNIEDMADKKSNKSSIVLDIVTAILSFAVMIAGVVLCIYAIGQITEVTNIDTNALMRSPSEYMDVKRDMIIEGLSFIVPGIVILLLGVFVLSIMTTRLITMIKEGRQLNLLEKRVENLEKKLKK